MNNPERHLSHDSFVTYLGSTSPLEHPIDGEPRIVLFFDPHHGRIGLRGPARSDETPGHTGLEHLQVTLIHHHGQRMIEVSLDEPGLFVDAYAILCGVADRMQLDGLSLTRALTDTLRRLGHLIRAGQTLTREVETGLIGELVLLTGLAATTTPELALQAWRGGSEEHDFGLADIDVEVKTTTSETRSHRISSLTQLQPTGARPLWLLSIQLTRSGAVGTTLADMVGHARQRFPTSTLRDEFDTLVQSMGWRTRFADTALQRWRLRTEPVTYHVTTGFPRLTPAMLKAGGVDLDTVSDLRYRIDLTGRPADTAPALLTHAIHAGGEELR